VTDTVDAAAMRTRYWPVPIIRAVPAAIVAMIITFSANHAAGFGLVLFGSFAVVEGVVLILFAARRMPDRASRRVATVQGLVTGVAGLVGFSVIESGVAGFKIVVIAFAVVSGFLELGQGIRARRTSQFARDWQTIGGITLLLAILLALTPTGYAKQLGGIEHVKGSLDSAIIVVGFFGAYLALTAVFDVIAGLSHKWGTAADEQTAPNGAPHV
jgi:uncharacterized membrane protein HdeD (DUF308 family)